MVIAYGNKRAHTDIDRRLSSMKKIWNKLRGTAGESLAETLVAVLIIAFASIVLAGMISATVNMVKRSESSMKTYYAKSADLEKMVTENTTEIKINLTLKTGDKSTVDDIKVKYDSNSELANYTVVAYAYAGSGTGG